MKVSLVLALVMISSLAAGQRPGRGDNLTVLAVAPAARTIGAAVGATITVQFDRAVDPATVTPQSFWAFGRWSGPKDGAFSFGDGNQRVTLSPARPFSAGEHVMVVLSHQLAGEDGAPLRAGGYSYQFWVAAAANAAEFDHLDTLYTRTDPNETTRAYGGVATDFSNDGWVDLAIVNEDTADIRVFLNRADGSGLYHDFLKPPAAVNARASPSEPSDFNRDGLADLAVVNIDANSVSVLLGNGDGTFAPQQEIMVGVAPRGIAVLDVDGDGDTDIVNTNWGQNNLSLLLNDGNGVFGPPAYFDGGGEDEWALAAADMNEDGILDLVIGGQDFAAPTVMIAVGNGDGTFTNQPAQNAGGRVWMLNVGDVNGDGHEDVATANGGSNNGSILPGDGLGGLGAPEVYPMQPFVLATDLGDLDGDGDLDWITSSFLGDWQLYLNDGLGTFAFDRLFEATEAGSCALMLDFDNDGDLDLALIDEIADEVILMKNRRTVLKTFVPAVMSDDSPAGFGGVYP